MKALLGHLSKEVRHILRDRRTLAVVGLMPVVQVMLFGLAIRSVVKVIRLAFVVPSPVLVSLEIGLRV
jgi:ABC-2 type transport system permease protein